MSNLNLTPALIGQTKTLRTERKRWSRSQGQVVTTTRETTGVVTGYETKSKTTADGTTVSAVAVIFGDKTGPSITFYDEPRTENLSAPSYYGEKSDEGEAVEYIAEVNGRGLTSVEFIDADEAEAAL